MKIRLLGPSDVEKALPMSSAIEAMGVAFGALTANAVEMPVRLQINVPGISTAFAVNALVY